jgi:hypothetical protein
VEAAGTTSSDDNPRSSRSRAALGGAAERGPRPGSAAAATAAAAAAGAAGAGAGAAAGENGEGSGGGGGAPETGAIGKDNNSNIGQPPVMPYTQVTPPPGWLQGLKDDRDRTLLSQPGRAEQQRPRRRQRLVHEIPVVPTSPQGTLRFSFAPRQGEIYHLWCAVDGAARIGPGRMVSVIFDDAEGNVCRNYRALLVSRVLRQTLSCCTCIQALCNSNEALRASSALEMYPNMLLAVCRQLRSARRPNSDREALASMFARYGITSTELSMMAVEQLVLEDLRMEEHEAEEQGLLLQWERDRLRRAGIEVPEDASPYVLRFVESIHRNRAAALERVRGAMADA